jgi:hypothetical protein
MTARAKKVAYLATELAAVLLASRSAAAQDTKRECIAAATEGQTLRKDEKLIEARDQILTCARDACPPVVKSHCARWLTEIQDQIPTLVVRVQDGNGADLLDANLTIDGKPAKLDGKPVELDPGNHALRVETQAGLSKEGQVLLVDGEKSRRVLLEVPTPAAPAGAISSAPPGPTPDKGTITKNDAGPPQASGGIPAGAWILGGFGLIALGVGGYFTYATYNELDTLNKTCAPNCTDSQTALAHTYAVVADAGWVVGGVSVAGAILWGVLSLNKGHDTASRFIQPAPHTAFDVQPTPGGGFARFTASF